jgi:Tol biopolymer transport system component
LCANPSPDGKTILYISNDNDTVYNLYVLNVSEKTVKKLTNYTDWNVGAPSYSVDGKKILFNLYHGDATQIYTANADGSEPIEMTSNTHSLCPRYGQIGSKIYFCSYGTGDDSTLNVFAMNSTGTEVKELTTEGGASPSWTPELPTPISPIPAAK